MSDCGRSLCTVLSLVSKEVDSPCVLGSFAYQVFRPSGYPAPASEWNVIIMNCSKLEPQQYPGIWVKWRNVNT